MKPRQGNKLRIIGGMWRGRKLPIPNKPGLRPTPDRVRETLFNWLQPYIHGARCLDLYAGTGVLGLEAVSRGAASATLVEIDTGACQAISLSIETLQNEQIHCIQSDVCVFLKSAQQPKPVDIVFLDPPYHQGLDSLSCELLLSYNWLKPGALVYLESETRLTDLTIPDSLELLKSKQSGQVAYHLLQFHPGKTT